MRISDWSSDVCSSDLLILGPEPAEPLGAVGCRPAHWRHVHRQAKDAMSGRDKSVRRVPRYAGIVEQGELQVHAHHETCGLKVGALPAAASREKQGMALRQRTAQPGAQAGEWLLPGEEREGAGEGKGGAGR